MTLYELIDYETLRVIWWVLLGVLLIGLAATDGFDMGTAALLPFVAKTDTERRVVINTIGPVWEGNQVWLILGGGAIFAAWPHLYALSFSGFYLAMFAVLASLILRPVGFKYRSKRDSASWRARWDWALFVGGAVPALIFGVAVGNVIQGVPFELLVDQRPVYGVTEDGEMMSVAAKFFGLLNPFALLCGVLSLAMLTMHGGAWLAMRTEGVIAQRARNFGSIAAILVIALFALCGALLYLGVFGEAYAFKNPDLVATSGPSNPLYNEVVRASDMPEGEQVSWFDNYAKYPWMLIAPALGFLGALGALIGMRAGKEAITFISSKLSVFGVISTVGLSMFPFILPSSTNPNSSLTVWDASSSHQTLWIMLVVTVIFLPIVLAYTIWVYKVLWGKVTEKDVTENSDSVY